MSLGQLLRRPPRAGLCQHAEVGRADLRAGRLQRSHQDGSSRISPRRDNWPRPMAAAMRTSSDSSSSAASRHGGGSSVSGLPSMPSPRTAASRTSASRSPAFSPTAATIASTSMIPGGPCQMIAMFESACDTRSRTMGRGSRRAPIRAGTTSRSLLRFGAADPDALDHRHQGLGGRRAVPRLGVRQPRDQRGQGDIRVLRTQALQVPNRL